MIELRLDEIRVSTAGDPPLVVLKECEGERRLPIWTSFEGAATVVAVTEARDDESPGLLDVVAELVAEFGVKLESVHIVSHYEGRFFAQLVVAGREIGCKPTDAIALALRTQVPIRCPEQLLREVGVLPEPAKEVERFREFLETVDPTDFEEL
ncbi:MAG: bifunctional nuclease family protein [Propionibacteriaceae bacterium]|jgi:bifunctional DNase/RNase|nr:bifunctional nuclease family protein [Propionibacteriaceae bacterium]